jgi:hypothetical protein
MSRSKRARLALSVVTIVGIASDSYSGKRQDPPRPGGSCGLELAARIELAAFTLPM